MRPTPRSRHTRTAGRTRTGRGAGRGRLSTGKQWATENWRLLAAVPVAAAIPALFLWPRPVNPATECAIGIDGYGSTQSITVHYTDWLKKIAPECVTGPGSAVVAYRIDSDTLGGQQVWLRQDELTFIDEPAHDRAVINKAVDQFIADITTKLLEAKDPARGGTDIISAATVAARAFTSHEEHKILIWFTDGINSAASASFVDTGKLKAVDLSTPESRRALLDRLDAENLIPDLNGVEVRIYGAGATGFRLTPARLQAIKDFWSEYFARAGAHLTDYTPTPPTR